MGLSRGFYMTVYFDANNIYDAGTKAMQSSKFKHGTQLFEMNHLLTTAHIRRGFITGDYKPDPGNKFPINERGHPRYITSNTMVDKTVNHLLCDEVLTPSISKYLIYDNGASQKGKGVAFHRRRFEARLHQYFMQNGTSEGYILLVDFSGYYANIPHDKCLEVLQTFLEREVEDPETLAITEMLLSLIFKTFEQDVSRFTDKEIEAMMAGKIDPMLNCGVDPALLTGEKMLRKGVDIGSQPSQNIGIVYPYRLDNYAIVAGVFHRSQKSTDGALESRAGWKGLCRKGTTLLVVLVACRLDLVTGSTFIRDTAIIAFIANETISIIENAGLMGVPVPAVVAKAIDILKQKAEGDANTSPGKE